MSQRITRFVLLAALSMACLRCGRPDTRETDSGGAGGSAPAPSYVGSAECAPCHAAEDQAWRASDHALAMQEARDGTVLGNFSGARFTYAGVTSTFFRRGGGFFVRTDGPDGALHDYPIKYTFGVRPLQQYLVEFPGGRLQALGIAWDARSGSAGGQRWFHLYPRERLRHGDPLHWTGRNQNWNSTCADCHSTHLRKNYDLERDAYATTWSEINVACEACHGPGSSHVAWASATGRPKDSTQGLVVPLTPPVKGAWVPGGPGAIASRWTGPSRSTVEIETCVPCHSRRRPIVLPDAPGRRFLDRYMPALLDEGLYYPDGQIRDEVYEYGSFLQSRMYGAGVVCSDCHDPHGLGLRAAGNALCARCHDAGRFDTSAHHHHRAGTPGSRCVECHMPRRTYMEIDVRRDHGMRIPRPDLSGIHHVPNACTQCHSNRSDRWAAETVAGWPEKARPEGSPFVAPLDGGRHGRADAGADLARLIADSAVPAVARATALTLLPSYPTAASGRAATAALQDSDPLVRMAAARVVLSLPAVARAPDLVPLLQDPIRAVRIEAARALAEAPANALSAAERERLDAALPELIASEETTAERPESHLNLSLIQAGRGRLVEAESELKTALRLDPRWIPAMVTLADVYRATDRDSEGEPLLEQAMRIAPHAAEPVHALGLLRERQGRRPEALALLARASRLLPESARFAYVYAVALQSAGRIPAAAAVLGKAHEEHPADLDILVALIGIERDRGEWAAAKKHGQELTRLAPDDPAAAALVESLSWTGRPDPP